jgi:hypothetical protein
MGFKTGWFKFAMQVGILAKLCLTAVHCAYMFAEIVSYYVKSLCRQSLQEQLAGNPLLAGKMVPQAGPCAPALLQAIGLPPRRMAHCFAACICCIYRGIWYSSSMIAAPDSGCLHACGIDIKLLGEVHCMHCT